MLKRLRLKFICIIMAIVMVMLCVIFGLTIHMTQWNLREESLRNIQQAISAPGFASGGIRPPNNDRFITPQVSYFILTKLSDGRVVASGTSAMILSEDTPFEEFWQIAQESEAQTGTIDEYDLLFFRIDAPMGERCVFLDISAERATMATLYRNCVIIGVVVFLCFLPVSVLLARWAVRPVAQAWEQQRQFIADASHELKTPLTVIMTNAELLQNPNHNDDARLRFSQSIQTTAQDMRHLVEGLLELARADNAAAKPQMHPLDFSQLTSESTLPFEAVFFEKDLMLDSWIRPNIMVSGDSAKLKQVLDILLDNAQKYAQSPGQVVVQLTEQGKNCLLCVQTPGEPISKADLSNIFKRFYRIDKARSRNGSYGLGLSIAQHIVTSHGGRIWAESAQGVNRFFVQLPTITP